MKQSLNGEWQFRTGSDEWLPASVPGGVHTDLLNAGRISDPFVGDEENRTQWVAEQDWEYRRTLEVGEDLLAHDRVYLVCEGLDTLAEVRLNGQTIGRSDNMFTTCRWDVREALHPGDNELLVLFDSPVKYAHKRNSVRPMPDVNNPLPGSPYLRKAPSHFGWDWGPRLPAVGIWRDIYLEGCNTARLTDVAVRQQHTAGNVTLLITGVSEAYRDTPLTIDVLMTAPDGNTQIVEADFRDGVGNAALTVDNPQLWWPNGYGAQPLYTVDVELKVDGKVLDSRSYQVGFRTIELRQEPDEWGKSFTFVVNDVPIFAKGSNWIPADTFPTRITHEQLSSLLGSAAAAHHNMVRVWGGGYYEDEAFYDLCDRYGLLVWQDFMFACAGYPLNDEPFLASIRGEVVDNVRRLRHRACVALWCGNNEIESAWVGWGWNTKENADLIAAYVRFFYGFLPAWIMAEDPDRPYWASSPSSGEALQDPDGLRSGDIHQWAVWHANKPFSHYRETPARFVSEFGFQSFPSMATIAEFARPSDWNVTSYAMEHHQRSPVGNEKIIFYLLDHFRMPKDFPSTVYLSQLLQAEAMRVGVEGWRRHPACSGALYWQLNDCWPVISWAGIDYYGRWKAMHYSSRRFFDPLLLSIEDEGTSMKLYVTNDRAEPWSGNVSWTLETLHGERLDGAELGVDAAPFSSTEVAALDFTEHVNREKARDVVLVCELRQGGKVIQTSVATFAPTKHLNLQNPRFGASLSLEDNMLSITLRSDSLARFVEVGLEGADVIFSDNYFDIPANRARTISAPLPDGWTAADAEQALRLRSVFDSY